MINTALIVAAGSSSRMQSNQSKVLEVIGGKPLFKHSVDVFLSLDFNIVLVVSSNDYANISNLNLRNTTCVIGGATRKESVLKGLKHVNSTYVWIHDAARPLISKQTIETMVEAQKKYKTLLLCEPVTSALKQKKEDQIKSVDRNQYILAQTPQVFLTEQITQAHQRINEALDDDISVFQKAYPNEYIHLILNEEPNLKVTYQKDFKILRSFTEKEPEMRIGHSFDIHQTVKDRPLILGGIHIESPFGLLGHSDADVLLHVISEAILGALALGDLGTLFPDTDKKNKDISSVTILNHVLTLLNQTSYQISHLDTTIYAEEPKLNPYIKKLRTNVAALLDIDFSNVSIKATTYEKLDSIGAKKAIAAEAVILLKEARI